MESSSQRGPFAMYINSTDEDAGVQKAQPVLNTDSDEWNMSEKIEGKLAVDVAHDAKNIIVVSTMAGSVADKIDVYVHNDLLTIRGMRVSPLQNTKNIEYFYEECYWGVFSRAIVLPTEVKGELAHAEYKNGILTVTIPKQQEGDRKIQVEIVDD